MSVIAVIMMTVLCVGHAEVHHDSEPADSASCENGQQCGADTMGLLQAKVRTESAVTTLTQADFAGGTKRITAAGVYELGSDIVFEPNPLVPPLDSVDYQQQDGYFLGFFAAVAIEGTGITFDCKGHKMSMSKKFHKHQRFYAHIELGSKPFIQSKGPPPFSRPPSTVLRKAEHTTIQNCNFGLSSHFAIHGNEAEHVTIQDIAECKDYEVSCVSLNNCRNCELNTIDAGPNLKSTFPAELSQAIFLNHMVNVVPTGLPLNEQPLNDLIANTDVKIRGATTKAAAIFTKFKNDLDDFLDNDPPQGALTSLLGIKAANDDLPDGSAVYGIVMNKAGPAVGVFGAEEGKLTSLRRSGTLVPGAKIYNINVHDLELKPVAWVTFRDPVGDPNADPVIPAEKRKLQDPAGAIFRASQLKDNWGNYVGNSMSDAQIAVGTLIKATRVQTQLGLLDETLPQPGSVEAIAKQYYGGSWMTQPALDWANGDITWDEFESNFVVGCMTDAMDHHNKGVVGIRLEYLDEPHFQNLRVTNIVNRGVAKGQANEDPNLCTDPDYGGNDVYGLMLSNIAKIQSLNGPTKTYYKGRNPRKAGAGGEKYNVERLMFKK